MPDLTTLTPAEIDALWAPIATREYEAHVALFALRQAVTAARRVLDQVDPGVLGRFERERAQRTIDGADKRAEALTRAGLAAVEEQAPFTAEWARRGGWTRAYLVVTNGQGHVHRTMGCSTCYSTTQFHWMTEYSGASEQEIVDAAGERACTVCYKSAPVQLRLDRPSRMFSEDEKAKQAAREERAAKKAEKDAKRLLDPVSGEVLRSIEEGRGGLRAGYVIGNTERGAMNAAVAGLNSWLHYGPDHPSAEAWVATADLVAAALAAKHGTNYAEVRRDLNERGVKSYRRESGRAPKRQFPEVIG